jgi:acyl-CoA thioesterase
MGDFSADTALTPAGATGENTRFTRLVHRDWEIWGPNGGYMVALALRAAGVHSRRDRPANVSVHFLGVAGFDEPVTIAASTLRASRTATSVQVEIAQGDRRVLQAMVWAVDAELPGLTHVHVDPPDVPPWHQLPSIDQRWEASGQPRPPSRYRFWDNFDQRPAEWIDDWENRGPTDPVYLNWLRFVPTGRFDDPWIEAARLALLVDLGAWPAASARHNQEQFIAPSIDVSCEFHHLDDVPEWVLLHGASPHAGSGLVASHQQVWSDDGRLLASGISHLLCRDVTARPVT